jgi:hypothetical protein
MVEPMEKLLEVWTSKHCSPRHGIPFKSTAERLDAVDDVASNI